MLRVAGKARARSPSSEIGLPSHVPPEGPYPAGDRLEVVGVGGVNAQGGIPVTTLFVVEQLKDILEVLALEERRRELRWAEVGKAAAGWPSMSSRRRSRPASGSARSPPHRGR